MQKDNAMLTPLIAALIGAGDDQLHGDADTVSVPLAELNNGRVRWRISAANNGIWRIAA